MDDQGGNMATLNLYLNERPIKAYELMAGADILVGSAGECGIRIDHQSVAPRHAWIISHSGSCRIMALSEKAPILANQKAISDHHLSHGDRIEIGRFTLRFSGEDQCAEEATSITDSATDRAPAASGYVQILAGSHLGRIIPLDHGLTRLGKAKRSSAVIARRKTGYFLSHLEGPIPPKVDGSSIGEQSQPLRDGNIIEIGRIRMAFHAASL
jgi:predicted component of type VI protein secretion system